MKPTTIAIACAALCLANRTFALDYYLSPTGADSGNCTSSGSPCATIAYALTQAAGPGDVINLASGTYTPADQTLVTKSGSAGSPLTIRGAGIDATILDGSALVQNRALLKLQADYVVVEDLTARASTDAPIWVERTGHTIQRVHLSAARGANAACLYLLTADHVVVDSARMDGCAKQGIQIAQSNNVTINRPAISGAKNHGIQINTTTDVVISGATITGNGTTCVNCNGIYLSTAERVTVGAWQHQQPTVIDTNPSAGVAVSNCGVVDLSNIVLVINGSGVEVSTGNGTLTPAITVNHAVIVNSTSAPGVVATNATGTVTVKNSILAFNALGDMRAATIAHSYNLRYQNGTGNVALGAGEFNADPLFAASVTKDFHLKSTAGRYFPATGWVLDTVNSPAIDRADPAAPYSYETAPNGGVANTGAYGNTVEASRSAPRPDAGQPDTWQPDAARPDTAVLDTVMIDTAMPDTALVDTIGQPVIARAGPDQVAEVPADVVLDGTASRAPADAVFTWTQKVGPAGALDTVIGGTAQTTLRVDQAGLWVFELRVEANGVSSTDLLQVEARTTAVPTTCDCRQLDRRGGWLLLGFVLTALIGRRQRRAR